MLRFIWQKLIHKKWMVLSLLIGNILLVAIAASHPMYQEASLSRMLNDEFEQYMEANNQYPAIFEANSAIKKKDYEGFYQAYDIVKNLDDRLDVTVSQLIEVYSVQESKANTAMKRLDNDDALAISVSTMSDLENHVKIISGRMYNDTITEDGYIETIISESAMVRQGLLLNDDLEFKYLVDGDGNSIKLRVVGIYENSDISDEYWVKSPDEYKRHCMIPFDIFNSIFLDENNHTYIVRANWYSLFDYDSIKVGQVDSLVKKTNALVGTEIANSKFIAPNYMSVLLEFVNNQHKVSVTLLILQVPVLLLLCSFLFMISGQLLGLEQNEISQLKSRGAGRLQIFMLYLVQSILLSLVSFVAGLPLGSYLCRALGSSNAFLEFVQRRPLKVSITPQVLLYAFGAVLVSILMTVLPVIRYSKVSIVNLKQKKARSSRRLWQKLYLDVIAIAISIYGYAAFFRQKDELAEQVYAGKSLDPLLFLCSSLFILGVGLFTIRFQPLLVKLIFFIGKKRWKPASYSSFLQLIRTGTKQHFIMTFLIMTVALGIFNSTVARTILSNAENNEKYVIGADLVVKEFWKSNEVMVKYDPTIPLVYQEPGFDKYEQMPQIQSVTKVWKDEKGVVKLGRKDQTITIMGINTKKFGETTNLPDDLLFYDYYDYLNAMSQDKNAVIVSMNFKEKLEYKLGDSIVYENSVGDSITGTICGFVDYWPSYQPEITTLLPDNTTSTEQKFLVIANLSTLQDNYGITPYEVWMKVNGSTQFIYDYADEHNMQFVKFEDLSQSVLDIRNETLFQGTNGILTMSFIIILILCCAGFLIYWILSIRSRELLFGVFRAMGMGKREILHMLVNEQLFSGVYSILAGTGVGILASNMFVPLIQIAYSANNQVLPMELLTESSDLIRLLAVIAVVFIGCLIILARLIFSMKISQALKLGED